MDECADNPEICDQECVNTEGSYRCVCREGFALGHDGECNLGKFLCGNLLIDHRSTTF